MNEGSHARRVVACGSLKIMVGIVALLTAYLLLSGQHSLLAQSGVETPAPHYLRPGATEAAIDLTDKAPRQTLIVGGEDAAVGELPWQVAVYPGPYLCGGSLIDAQWVVTAAHCVVGDDGNLLPAADVEIVAGEYNRSLNDGTEQQRAVSQVVVHPDYDADTSDNDIALLRLAAPVTLGTGVGIVPLISSPTHDTLVAPGVLSMVSGWGATSDGGSTAAILQKVQAPIVSNATCNAAYGLSLIHI